MKIAIYTPSLHLPFEAKKMLELHLLPSPIIFYASYVGKSSLNKIMQTHSRYDS